MITRLYILLLLLFNFLTAFSSNEHYGIPIVNRYSASEYGAGSQNWGISQNEDGFIYIANNFGLLEFNGVNWNTFTMNKGNNNLKSVLAINKRIYVGGQHEFGYFERNTKHELKYVSLLPLIDSKEEFDEIWNIYSGRNDNEIIFCSHRKVFRFDGSKITSITPPQNIFYTFYINGDFISSSPEIGLLNWNNKRILPQYKGTKLLKGHMVRSIINFPNGLLLALSHDGKLLMNSGDGFEPWATDTWDTFKDAKINSALLLKDNSLAIATQNDGVYILDEEGKVQLHINKKNGLSDMSVYQIFQDQTENLWLAHRNGLSYIEIHSPFSLINEQIGIDGGGYAASFFQNTLYLGTSNGVFKYDPKGPFLEPNYNKINIGHTYNLTVSNGYLFQGQHEGLYALKDTKNDIVTSNKGAWNAIYIPEKDAYLQGAYDGLLIHRFKNGQWNTQKLQGFNESCRLIKVDNYNTIWMSHGFKGVFRLKIDYSTNQITKADFYGKEKGFYSNVLINLFTVNNELIFCGENGVYTYDQKNDRFIIHELYTKLLGTERVSSLTNDEEGNLYFIQNNKVGAVYSPKSNSPYVERQLFERINKYISDDLESIIVIDPSNVLITAKEGFIRYNPRFKQVVHNNIPLSITQFSSSNGIDYKNELNEGADIKINYANNDISFSYATPFFDGLEYNSYQTFLEGFDKLPKPWNTQPNISYTNLKEGEYTFQVTSKNIYGEVSKMQKVKFTILAPWYRTSFAYLIYLILTAGFVFLITRISKKRYSKKWLSILGQKEQQIEDQDGTIKKLLDEKHHQEIDFKNKELALSAFHLSQRNALLTSIKTDLIKVSTSAEDVRTSKELHHLAVRISKEIDDEKDWARFKDHFNLIHSDFFEYFKENYPQLSTQELKICAYIKMNMSTKDIANALNLSVRGVETSRYRLRKKLNLEKGENLLDFIAQVETQVEMDQSQN
ncbi:triple tyrosine motif-containing protein [Flammeovirga sp. SubArs3]|uniref:LuxR C-terminal-related transcriptional regulator n=1 Tax=Flammeovirga sp. SubArs3 TaxID=2995316 RepID=UPI00248C743A|nr:triple tyrosine motif-containing protein [Flammeovirga sp. SubArs3]